MVGCRVGFSGHGPSRKASLLVLWKSPLAWSCSSATLVEASPSVASTTAPIAQKCSAISISRHHATSRVNGSTPPGILYSCHPAIPTSISGLHSTFISEAAVQLRARRCVVAASGRAAPTRSSTHSRLT
eukprot:1273642-Rhodomonas_salina.2